MPKTINQKVLFKNTTVSVLYNLYMNQKLHAEVTAHNTVISEKEGAAFATYNSYFKGKNLRLIKNKLIVQSVIAADWNKTDAESTLILLFEQNGKDATVYMTHANIPDDQAKDLASGWHEFYWKLWKEYLKN